MLTKEVKGTSLENAVFEIYTDKDKLVDTITTKKDGKATSKLLEYGNYNVKEKDTGSDYYLLNTEKYEIQIREHNKTIPVTIDNKSVEVGLDIDKTGLVQAQPNDEIKYSFNSLKNTSNVALDNFTWTDNLPIVKAEDKWINYTKLTGNYKEHELEDKAEWPTILYSKKLEVKELPRTGY